MRACHFSVAATVTVSVRTSTKDKKRSLMNEEVLIKFGSIRAKGAAAAGSCSCPLGMRLLAAFTIAVVKFATLSKCRAWIGYTQGNSISDTQRSEKWLVHGWVKFLPVLA